METDTLAKRVINESLQITKKDNVQVYCNKHTIDLAEALTLECQKVGAHANISLYTDKIGYDFYLDRPIEYLETPDPFSLAFLDVATITIGLSELEDPTNMEKVTPERWTALGKGDIPYREKALKSNQRGAGIHLGYVTPQRTKVYGFDYRAWKENMHAAIGVDYSEMQKLGAKLRTALGKAKEIRITNAAGSDLSTRVEGGQIKVDDGILDRKGSKAASQGIELPGGSITVVPDIVSAKGAFVSDIAVAAFAKMVKGISWKFERGAVTSFEGGENIGLLKDKWLQATGDRDKIGFIQFGLNANAKPGFLYNDIIRGAVTVGIGENRWYGGKNESSGFWIATSVAATVKLDKKTIIDKGKMVL